MSKIKSLDELQDMKKSLLPKVALRIHTEQEKSSKREIMFCAGTGCLSSDSMELAKRFEELLKEHKLDNDIKVVQTGCFGFCGEGPIVKIFPDDVFYTKVTLEGVDKIVQEHLIGGTVVEEFLFTNPDKKEPSTKHLDINFYKKQERVALRNCGLIDPECLDEYIAVGGYEALGQALTKMERSAVSDVVKLSGLRGRGGGGFPTGLKWELTAKSAGDQKYVICNADEGDPGAFMDRSILEGDPHSVVEAMAIAGYVIGADTGYVYIRAEYPTAVNRLRKAISDATEKGLLGENILGTDFTFNLNICLGAGAFVCGEETALIASIEGNRGMPSNKPPFPAESGLWGKPTLINNVETYANIPQILLRGGDWFKSMGTEKSAGTKVFALGGKINTGGLVEVPMGTTLREIIYDIGGGIPNGKDFKAVQTGGPSGGCITKKDLDAPIDFEVLASLGSIVGSGGMIVMDEDNCMVDIAKYFLDFTVDESCGKCTPCREGTKRMYEILEKITTGQGTLEDIDKLEELATVIKDTSLCGLGQTAPNPVLSTLANFRDEYLAHVLEKKCPAGTCKELLEYYITEDCIGCTKCARNCPVSCINGKVKERHVIDTEACIKCGTCQVVCPVGAVIKK